MTTDRVDLGPEVEYACCESEGIRRFRRGDPIQCSSDISDNTTYGYGRLDRLGYWQYPVPAWMVEERRAIREQATHER